MQKVSSIFCRISDYGLKILEGIFQSQIRKVNSMWKRKMIPTHRGEFEVFTKGEGQPLCITHLYSEFNELGNYFADVFVEHFSVYLINLRDAGHSCKSEGPQQLSMEQTCIDLEAVREAIGIGKWGFAGHSTGGMLGLVYGIHHSEFLTKIMIGGASASNEYMDHPGSMYSQKSQLNKRVKEYLATLKSPDSSREERIHAGMEWTKMSLFKPENYDVYFSKPSSGRVVQKRLDYYSFTELPDYNLTRLLSRVKTPAFVYCGRHDAQCPLIFSEEIHKYLPVSEMFVYEESNHVPYLEEKEEFLHMVSKFAEL
jgi:proline iminopeptidase